MTGLRSSGGATLIALPLVLVSLAGLGCADPEGAFNDFETRDHAISTGSSSSGAGGNTGCTVPMPDTMPVDYFFSLSTKIAKTKPIVMLATSTLPAMGSGTAVQVSAQPLKAADMKTPTGTPLMGGPVAIATDGTFTLSFGTINIPGDANPIQPGVDVAADAVIITGKICEPPDFVCGTLTGMLTKPIPFDLAGSTWTMQKITDPNKYPTPILDCAMTKP